MSKWRPIGTLQPRSSDDGEERTGNGRPMHSSNTENPYTRPGGSSDWTECSEPRNRSQNAHLYRGRHSIRQRDPMREIPLGRETDPVLEGDRMTPKDLVRKESQACVGTAAFMSGLGMGLYGGSVDGGVLELSEEDQELARKKKELLLIEQEILRKKSFIAVKAHGALSLEERVNAILNNRRRDQDYPYMVSSKPVACQKTLTHSLKGLHGFLERRNNSILSEDRKGGFCPEYREEPPVKGRVEALMQHRRSMLAVASNEKNPDDPEQNRAAKGFQRFLNILNKGVDIDRLAKIVNSDSDGHGNPCSPSPLDSQSEGSHKSDSLGRDPYGAPWRDHGGARWGDHIHSPSGERRMELTGLAGTQVKHHSRSLSPLTNSATGSHVGSGTRSRSPAPAERRKEPGLENELSHGQLQGLLQTIGLTLGEEELGRLTDRTQERLFGKKEDKSKERLKERLLKLHRCSSSSSSSPGPSPPRQLHSSDKASGDIRDRSRTSNDRHSRDRDRDKDRDRDRDRDRNRDRDRDRKRDGDRNRDRDRERDRDKDRDRDRDRHRTRDGDRDRDRERDGDRDRGNIKDRDRNKDRKGVVDEDRIGDQHNNMSSWSEGTDGQYPTNQTYPYPYPLPVNPPYTTPHYSQYTPCVSAHYPGMSLPSWGFPPGPLPPSPYPYEYLPPNPVNPLHYYNGLSAPSTHTDTYNQPTANVEAEDVSQLFNPDLSLSEGQEMDNPRPRCLLEPQMKTNNRKKGTANNMVVVKKKGSKSKKTQKRAQFYQKIRWQRKYGLVGCGAPQANAVVFITPGPQALHTPGSQAISTPGPQAFSTPGPQASSQGVCGVAATQQNPQIRHRKPLLHSEKKKLMTEEEMKAQLKKKLAEFNMKMKQNPIQPKETVSLADELD